jgi:ADP-dependent NAD(P)H-hydrate dehydratase / NAD(P)H-hydrate epimerase
MQEINKDILKEIYQERPPQSRKYDYGLMIVIGGSDFYSGSPALSALAGFRTGVDMVRIIAPQRPADIIASFSPILASYPLEGKRLSKEHLPTLLSMTESAKAVSRGNVSVILGGGIGRTEETQQVVLDYLSQISIPIIIDADAIYAVKERKELLAEKECVLTPHYYEFFSLTGKQIYEFSLEDKIRTVQEEALNLNATILLKGEVDIISDGQQTAISRVGSPYLTVGGCGDTLAGILGALVARKKSFFTAACAAAYINSSAGLLAANELKDSVTAMDLIDRINKVINN